MRSENSKIRFLLLTFLVISIIAGIVQETNGLDITERFEQLADDDEKESTPYVQSFDVMAQNVQLHIDVPLMPVLRILEIRSTPDLSVFDAFDLTSTNYFRVLFRSIIAPNAP